jgi:curved DNA-binding protein CbpA
MPAPRPDSLRLIAARLLDVAVDATPDQLKVAYRAAVKRTHPDLFPPAERHDRTDVFNALTAAYELMCNLPRVSRPDGVLAGETRQMPAGEVRFRTALSCPLRGARLDRAA